jgi:hypothetical protein
MQHEQMMQGEKQARDNYLLERRTFCASINRIDPCY